MLFSSFGFIFLFLPIFLIGFYCLPKQRLQLWFVFAASIFFYAYWSTTYVFLLLLVVLLNYFIASQIQKNQSPLVRKLLVTVAVIANLSILVFFKYYSFFVGSVSGLIDYKEGGGFLPIFKLMLPVGISFYTFQTMSFVIDVYRKKIQGEVNLLEYSTYLTLFTHQLSGPLVRYGELVPQLENKKNYIFNSENFWKGICFFIFGLSKKILIADRLGEVVDPLVTNLGSISTLESWFAMVGYSLQLYFDFSGYSDMAVGLGAMINLKLPQNFNSPYKALSLSEFWKRWHMTLSSWLRDYLYFPLGGSKGTKLLTLRNLFITMALGGLWHGANATFLLWGAIHGLILVVERVFRSRGWVITGNRFLCWLYMFSVVCIVRVFFRAPDVSSGFLWLKKVLLLEGEVSQSIFFIPSGSKDRFIAILIISFLIAVFGKNTYQMKFVAKPLNAFFLAVLFIACLSFMGQKSPFLYFQF